MFMQELANTLWIDGVIEVVRTNDWVFFERILIDGWALLRFLAYAAGAIVLGLVVRIALRRRKAGRWAVRGMAILLCGLSLHFAMTDVDRLDPIPPSVGPPDVDAAMADWLATDAITVTPQTLTTRRQTLAAAIWPDENFRDIRAVTLAEVDIAADNDLRAFDDVARRVVRLERPMRLGFKAVAHRLDPMAANGVGVLYHQGHHPSGALIGGRRVIHALLDAGHTVIALSMPGTGRMVEPKTIPTQDGPAPLSRARGAVHLHNALARIVPDDGRGLDLFLTASAMATNHLLAHLGADAPLAMLGLSGGGWTTTVYMATDDRIRLGIEVAGSQPKFLDAFNGAGGGDYETFHPSLTAAAHYLDLYTLAGSGAGRSFIQILNEFDPCCFFSRAAEIYAPYQAAEKV